MIFILATYFYKTHHSFIYLELFKFLFFPSPFLPSLFCFAYISVGQDLREALAGQLVPIQWVTSEGLQVEGPLT